MPDNKGAIPKLKGNDKTTAVDSRGYHDYGNVKHASYNESGKGGSGAKGKEADSGAWTTVSHSKGKRGSNPKGGAQLGPGGDGHPVLEQAGHEGGSGAAQDLAKGRALPSVRLRVPHGQGLRSRPTQGPHQD